MIFEGADEGSFHDRTTFERLRAGASISDPKPRRRPSIYRSFEMWCLYFAGAAVTGIAAGAILAAW